ncbi:MAG: hypothetical protein ACREMA_10635, partial [Longimicrobiales bacterium]
MPFLTELDERAEVKGSVDPLGLMALWSRFGREVVGNLTTVSNSVRGFTTLLIGLHLADLLREQLRGDAPAPLDTFIKFEQLCGYARVRKYNDTSVRGHRRAYRRLNELRRIPISTDFADQILSSQKIGGLCGLFTVPARSSGLVEPGDVRLTDVARDFVQRHYFPMLGGNAGVNALLGLLQRESFALEPTRRHEQLLDALARVHARRLRADERAFYRDHLVWGGTSDPTGGRQRQLADILLSIDTDEFGFPEFRQVQKRARAHEGLKVSLERIAHV